MYAKHGSTNLMLLLLVVASVALNVLLFRKIGEARIETQRPKPSPVVEVGHVRQIAAALGMRPASGKTEADIATDIKIAIGDAPVAPKRILSDENATMMLKLLDVDEQKAFADMQSFFKTIAGKRYLVIPEE